MKVYTAVSLVTLILTQPALAQGEQEAIALSPLLHWGTPSAVPYSAPANQDQLQQTAIHRHPRSHFQKALYLKQKGKINQALVEFLKSTRENPRLVRAFYEQALIFHERGYLQLAESSLQQALAVQPDYQQARLLLATVRLEQGKLQEAISDLGRSLGLGPLPGSSATSATNPDKPLPLPESPIPETAAPISSDEPGTRPVPSSDSQQVAAGLPFADLKPNTEPPAQPGAAPPGTTDATTASGPDEANQPHPLNDWLKGIPGIDPSVPENAPVSPVKKQALADPIAGMESGGPGQIITRTLPGSVDPSSLFKQPKKKKTGLHLPNTQKHSRPAYLPKTNYNPGNKLTVPAIMKRPGGKRGLPRRIASLTRPAPPKQRHHGWFAWLFRPAAPHSVASPKSSFFKLRKSPKAGPNIAEALKQQQDQLNQAISHVGQQSPSGYLPARTPPAMASKAMVPPAADRHHALDFGISIPASGNRYLPSASKSSSSSGQQLPSVAISPPAVEPAPAFPVAAKPASSTLSWTPPTVPEHQATPASPTLPAAASSPPAAVLLPSTPATMVSHKNNVSPVPVNHASSLSPNSKIAVSAGGLSSEPKTAAKKGAAQPSVSLPKKTTHQPSPPFPEPALLGYQLSFLQQPKPQSNLSATTPKPSSAASTQDPWSVRMKYLIEHGTDSLKPGEAFMFSEETGEGVIFLSDGQIIRRTLADPRDPQEVTRMRRPDLSLPPEIMYNLSLLGKLLPKADAPVKETESGTGFSLDQLMPKSDGLWGWFKNQLQR